MTQTNRKARRAAAAASVNAPVDTSRNAVLYARYSTDMQNPLSCEH